MEKRQNERFGKEHESRVEEMEEAGMVFVCCYCGKEIAGFGNDPNDFSEDFYKKHSKDALCCDKCYSEVVIPRKRKSNEELAKFKLRGM